VTYKIHSINRDKSTKATKADNHTDVRVCAAVRCPVTVKWRGACPSATLSHFGNI